MVLALALVTRRLVSRSAVPVLLMTMIFASSTLGMVQPLRIDHHGWQLALLALALSGLADPDRRRGGIVTGLASAGSLAIGLELLIYLALMGGAHVLFWVANRVERERLIAYAVSLSGGTAIAFLLFASYANRAAVCDALSPVWLGDALVGGALMAGLAMVRAERWTLRLALAIGAGLVLVAFHAIASPHCLTRLEGVSPEATELWLSHVREARPIYRHGTNTMALTLSLPIAGLIGFSLLAWRARRDHDLLRRTLAVALPGMIALLLLFWQSRTGPAAQLMAMPGAAAIAFLLAPLAYNSKYPLVRVPGTVLAVVAGVGAGSLLGPRTRTVVSVAVLLLGLALLWLATTRSEPLLGAGGALVALAAGAAAIRVGRWPPPRPARRDEGGAARREPTARDTWEALDRGEDPTA